MTLLMKMLKTEKRDNLLNQEHDSCGVVAVFEKDGKPTHDNLRKNIDALTKMIHRSGFINGEGDGAGILTDIPRKLWSKILEKHQKPSELAYSPHFVIGHLFIDSSIDTYPVIQENIREKFKNHGFEIIHEENQQVDSNALGVNGREQEPFFWQIASSFRGEADSLREQLLTLTTEIELDIRVHVASLSNFTVVYKIMGSANILEKYFLDLQRPFFESRQSIGHNRYSTNTLSHFFRVQPFSLLGHNGEINTIQKLRDEARMLDIPLVHQGSDSQDLNRIIEGLITKSQFSLFTIMELIFPPIYHEIKQYKTHLQDLYTFLRHLFGPFAQGPAAIVSRFENLSIFSVDALGLRPLWQVETTDTLFFSSEQGIVATTEMVTEPKPLSPGEKVGVIIHPEQPLQVLNHQEVQQFVYDDVVKYYPLRDYFKKFEPPHFQKTASYYQVFKPISNSIYLSFGWEKEHIDLAEQIASTGKEPIRSLGYDGPLAILSKDRVNLSDFLKETVAVVTNPAIDREREIEHFSTRMIIGGREDFKKHEVGDVSFEIRSPLLLEGELSQEIVEELGTTSLEQTIAYFSSISEHHVARFSLTFNQHQSIKERLIELENSVIHAIHHGAKIIILDDQELNQNENHLWLDPHITVAAIDSALRSYSGEEGNLRRKVSILVRSGALRHLHDLITLIGLGADAVSPYLLFATVSQKGNKEQIKNLYSGLNKGIEKVISTLGIHELRGYGRLFSSIGLDQEIAEILGIPNFFGSEHTGYSLQMLKTDAIKRQKDRSISSTRFLRSFRLLPRIWKSIGEAANGTSPYQSYIDKLKEEENENPIAIRHILDFDSHTSSTNKSADLSIGAHDLPFFISSMSFGSQNEIAFRAYAEAAYQLNMMSLNGEGGEIKDMLGKYPKNRGIQIASGRFGVNIELINSSEWIEIKVGQGAKPGEGGHLPGTKVSEKVAMARNATPGVDLISPSNNHDIYSIEDLAQIIDELKTANTSAKIIVKVPVVPNIGTIAVGIAKAGANVISLSGYDGGTGAARIHAIQFVGLPVEIGVKLAHQSLIESGLRQQVEIWADGGIKGGRDAVKLILLGANRIGFGTLAMVALGCTSCRGCHLDTCHVGISTQIDSIEEANERGLKRFVPREFNKSVDNLKRLFTAIAEETKELTAKLGATSLQDLVGKSELLKQVKYSHLLDLSFLLAPTLMNQNKQLLIESKQVQVVVGAEEIVFQDNELSVINQGLLNNTNRFLGSYISGERVRRDYYGDYKKKPHINYQFKKGSVPGNGLAAYLAEGVKIRYQGGAQDGVGKTAYGGKVIIMKTANNNGAYINGSVGKGFCYGAQSGLFIVQGNADSRAGIRLSGADLIFGGEVTSTIRDELGGIASRANIKGFAFEYMTNGRVVVLGDPGPWICSGMTGGVIYQKIMPELGLDKEAIKRRIAKGAKVAVTTLDQKGIADLTELLNLYVQELFRTEQPAKANEVLNLLNNLDYHFVRIVPEGNVLEFLLQTE